MNNPAPKMNDPFKWIRRLVTWHRWVGLTSALFVIMFAVTGILLNHTREFGLHTINVSSQWMIDWYGIPEPIITLERVVIDIHSGRFFGLSGVVITDLAAIAILFLAFSGVYTWFKKR